MKKANRNNKRYEKNQRRRIHYVNQKYKPEERKKLQTVMYGEVERVFEMPFIWDPDGTWMLSPKTISEEAFRLCLLDISEMPLHVNDALLQARSVAKWRLELGK